MKRKISVLLLIVLPFTWWACRKTEGDDNGGGKLTGSLVLTTVGLDSSNNLVLAQLQAANTVIFDWTPGSNRGTNASISYTLQIDREGSHFANAIQVPCGKGKLTAGFTVAELNDSLLRHWKAGPDTPIQLQARIIADVNAPGIAPDTSNVIGIGLTPYQPVSTTLYLVGTATPNGTNTSLATALTPSPGAPTTFTWQGTLTPGTFEFITTLGNALPSYVMGTDSLLLALRTTVSQPDSQFTVYTTAVYSITLDLLSLNISVKMAQLPPYSALWIIGSPFPSGWDINKNDPNPPAQLMQDADNPFVFTYGGVLGTGEFKIPTQADGNFGVAYYRPLISDPPITATGAQLVPNGGGPADANDYKWEIYTAGPYQITLDTRMDTIAIKPFVPYPQLWIMGQVNGWSTSGATPMVDSTPYVFTYKGAFPAGEFKIPTSTNTSGNYAIPYFRPYSADPPVTDTTAQFVPVGGGVADQNDYKWNITTPGTYEIILNQLTGIIHINYVGP